MSRDITIYEDDHIHLSVTVGHWGTRLFVAKTGPMGPRINETGEYGDLVESRRLTEMIEVLTQIRDDQLTNEAE